VGALYTITDISPAIYLDNARQATNGYQVTFTLTEFDEGHMINVPKLDDALIDARIKEVLAARKKLAKLGG
jgi:hypothetical protein